MSEFLDAITRLQCHIRKEREPQKATIQWLNMRHDMLQAEVEMGRRSFPMSHDTAYTISTTFSMRTVVSDETLERIAIDMEEHVFRQFKAQLQEKLYGRIQQKLEEAYARIERLCTNVIECEMVDHLFADLRKECGC
jgi:hypothetical protein